MLATAAVVVFASCAKEIAAPEETSVARKTITVKTDIATKTTLDANHVNIVWAGGEKISVFNDYNDENAQVSYVEDGVITVDVPDGTTEIYMHYPYYSGNTGGPDEVSVYISNAQTQVSPGVLAGNYIPMVAKGIVENDKAIAQFYPVAGALALNLYNTNLNGAETVQSVKVTPANANTGFYGSQSTDLTGDNLKYTSGNGAETAVTVTLTNGLELFNTAPADRQSFAGQIYVCLAKQSYANVKFEITTDKGVYTITSNATAFDLVNNDFVPVNINLAKASFDENNPVDPTAFSWELVKDELTVGDKVLIAAANSAMAMSTTQNSNNRGQVGITKNGNALSAVANAQVFEVVAGSVNNSIALKCLNGDEIRNYIYAASSSANYLRSTSTLNANASWDVTINTTSGVATIVAKGSNTRNTIQYNSGNSIFACYSSTGTGDVVFYRAGLPSANLSFPEASYSVDLGDSFTAPTLSNPHSVSVTYASTDDTIAEANESTGAITIKKAGKVTITAFFAGNSTYAASYASYELTITDPNVEQWVKTGIADITTSNVFVIVGGGYAVTNDNGTTVAPNAESVTISNNALSAVPDANLQWKLTGNATDGYSFSPASSPSTFLYCNTNNDSGSNNNIRVGTGARKIWEFDANGYMKTKDDKVVRYFSKYNNSDWRGYVNTSNGVVALEFYVKQGGSTPAKTLASISVTPPTKTTYTVGDAFDATGMVVTATYSDATTDDVTASATTDFATQVASAGNKTVTVSYTEGGQTETDTFNITVSAAVGTSTVTFTPGTDTDATTVTKEGITVEMTTMNNASYYQVYASQSMTVSSTTHTIIGISFTCTTSGTSKYGPGNASANGGTYSYSDYTGTWSGSASSVTILSTAQIRMTSLTITYQ